MTRMTAIIREHGNGFPDVGDYVVAPVDGEVYRVLSIHGPIQTGRSPGAGNWVRATVELAAWDDVTDDTEPTCTAVLDDDGGEDTSHG